VDRRPDADADQHIGPDAVDDLDHLIACIGQPLAPGHARRLARDGHRADEGRDLTLHPQPPDHRPAHDGHHQPDHDIGQRDRPAEDRGQQDHRGQVDQRRGDQEGERHRQRQAGAVKPMNSGIDEQEQNGVSVPRSAASVLAPSRTARPACARAFGREMALDVGDGEDQHRQQDEDLDHVIDEELHRPAEPRCRVEPDGRHALRPPDR
jgi:hypothetical protein